MKTTLIVVAFAALIALTTAKVIGFTADYEGTLYEIDGETGGAKVIGNAYADGGNTHVLGVVDGHLWVSQGDGYTVLSLDLSNGATEVVLGEFQVDATDIASLEAGHTAYPLAQVQTASGRLFQFGYSYISEIFVEEDGPLTQKAFVGDVGTHDTTDGVGTDATLEYGYGACLDPSDGETMYFSDYYNLRKVTPDGKTSRVAGSDSIANTEGVGSSSAMYYPGDCVVSADGSTVYVASDYCISKVDVATGELTFLAGCVDDSGLVADGVGTDALTAKDYKNFGKGMAMLPNGNLLFTESCEETGSSLWAYGSVIRQVNPATGEVSPWSGSYAKAGCIDGLRAEVGYGLLTGPESDDVVYGFGVSSLVLYNRVCGKYFPITETEFDVSAEELANCEDLEGGDLPGTVVITGAGIPITTDTNVGDTQINDDGELSVAEGATVNANSIVVAGNGSVFCNGGDLTASTLTLNADSFYRVLIASNNNGKGVINGNAKLAGWVVIVVDGAYDWAEGASNVILTFLTKEGGFKGTKTYTREPKFGRRLLQAAAAAVDCTDTECTATSSSGGDDDDVGLTAAVIILAVIIVLGIIAAIVIVARKTSDKNVSKMSAAAAPYGYSSSSSSCFGSSSSGYSF